jgi:adenosyl cobinamide kinase/adenosyl cobinamide phosphate guanylyltransferase
MNQPQKTIMQHNIETGQDINNAWVVVAGEVSDGSIRTPAGYAIRFRDVLAIVRRENAIARDEAWIRFQTPPQ